MVGEGGVLEGERVSELVDVLERVELIEGKRDKVER